LPFIGIPKADKTKADEYTREATKIDPTDPYNLIFAAGISCGQRHGDEALKIARITKRCCQPLTLGRRYTRKSAKTKSPGFIEAPLFPVRTL